LLKFVNKDATSVKKNFGRVFFFVAESSNKIKTYTARGVSAGRTRNFRGRGRSRLFALFRAFF